MSNHFSTLLAKNWGHPDKVVARLEMINMYKEITGHQKLPNDREYWTMCGRNATPEGELIENCEFDQLTKSGLITKDQWNGVELNKKIANDNQKLEGKWYQGTLINTFLRFSKNPGLVNIDHHCGSEKSCHLIKHIFNKIPNDCFVTINMVQRCGFYNSSIDSIIKDILKETYPLVPYKKATRYNGTDTNNTTMVMFYFYKSERSTTLSELNTSNLQTHNLSISND